jgi:diguanylate cyclase (GGDEF)-like protein/PAS domain S-box-containing protein
MLEPESLDRDLLEVLLSSSEEAVVCFRRDGTILLWNSAAERLYGHTQQEMIGKQVFQLLPLDELPAFLALLADPAVVAEHHIEAAIRMDKAGQRVAVQIKRSLVHGSGGNLLGILEKSFPLSAESTRFFAEAHLQLLARQLPMLFWTTDRFLRITSHWGPGFQRRRAQDTAVIGQSVADYFHCTRIEQPPVKQHLDALQGLSSRFELKNGSRTFDLSVEPFRDARGEVIGCLGLALDVTERKKSEQEIRYQATHDGLTGLVNSREFFESLDREVCRGERNQRSFALLLLDLNDLKGINDRYGHLAGNRALKRLARILKEHCRASDIAARFGGDEFAVLLLDADAAMAEHVADRVRSRLRQQPHLPMLSVSIGIAVYPTDAGSAQELFEVADKRLYLNKRSSRVQPASPAQEQSASKALANKAHAG